MEYAKSGRSGCRGCEATGLDYCASRRAGQRDGTPYDKTGPSAYLIPKDSLRCARLLRCSSSRLPPPRDCGRALAPLESVSLAVDRALVLLAESGY